jgi:hypothetical protein
LLQAARTITAAAAVNIVRYGNTASGFISVSLGNVAIDAAPSRPSGA